ncbi:MAG: translation initiation factor IF-3, partial [Desulfobacterales bacterium]
MSLNRGAVYFAYPCERKIFSSGGEGIANSKRTDRTSRSDKININRNIRAKEVRVIDPEGNQIGIIPTYKAIAVANDFGLDLVEISPNASPPVCKIMDYGRFKYERTKKKQEAKKKQTTFQLKEIKVRPKTGEHDLKTKINHINKFISRKDKVKVTVIFRGREITLTDLGKELLEKIVQETEEIAFVEQPPKFEGRTMVMVLAPK